MNAQTNPLIKVNELNWRDRGREGGRGRKGRGREAERPWRTEAEREVGPGTIERNEAYPEHQTNREGDKKKANHIG